MSTGIGAKKPSRTNCTRGMGSRRHRSKRSAHALPVLLGGMIGMLKPAGSLCPIHHWPPPLQIIATSVFMFQVVGMFPNVVDQNGKVPLHQGIVVTTRDAGRDAASWSARRCAARAPHSHTAKGGHVLHWTRLTKPARRDDHRSAKTSHSPNH
jgi:hypothetical protein